MKQYRRRFVMGVLASIACAAALAATSLPYDEGAIPSTELQRALDVARSENKRVLLVFGANWCEDCRALDKEIHSGGELTKLVHLRYVVVKVDVGHFDKNKDFSHLYGDPTGKGIPSVVVVTPKNEVVYETRAGELADARHMGSDAITTFFQRLADQPAGY